MLAIALSSEGYSVITSEDGQEGLDIARRERPDIVISNLNMPNLDGMEMIQQLRQEPDLAGVIIVVLSAVRTENPEALINAGVNAVMSKPVEFMKLLQTITDALQSISAQD